MTVYIFQIQILSIIDSNCHVLSGMKSPHISQSKDRNRHVLKHENSSDCKERILVDIPYVGISLISSMPEVPSIVVIEDY